MLLGSFLAKALDPVTWTVVLLAAFIGVTVVVFVVGSRAARAGVELNMAQESLTQVALLAMGISRFWPDTVFRGLRT